MNQMTPHDEAQRPAYKRRYALKGEIQDLEAQLSHHNSQIMIVFDLLRDGRAPLRCVLTGRTLGKFVGRFREGDPIQVWGKFESFIGAGGARKRFFRVLSIGPRSQGAENNDAPELDELRPAPVTTLPIRDRDEEDMAPPAPRAAPVQLAFWPEEPPHWVYHLPPSTALHLHLGHRH